MRVVLQRVREARVEVDGIPVGSIARGFLLFVGIGKGDGAAEIDWLTRKIAGLRIFEDTEGRMNLGLADVAGACLAVSQFTLYADCRKGNRPGFADAAPPEEARALYGDFVAALRARGVRTETGVFQADMQVHLVNDGPVTLLLERAPGD